MIILKREQKEQVIEELKEAMSRCNNAILTDYKGMSNAELTALRRKLREAGIEYRVAKNTLARFAAEQAGKAFLAGSFEGPMAIAFGYDEVVEPAKTLAAFIRTSPETMLSIKGGFMGNRLLSPDDVKALASMPSREVLIAQVLGGMQAPIAGIINCLAGPIRGLGYVLQARIKQLEGN